MPPLNKLDLDFSFLQGGLAAEDGDGNDFGVGFGDEAEGGLAGLQVEGANVLVVGIHNPAAGGAEEEFVIVLVAGEGGVRLKVSFCTVMVQKEEPSAGISPMPSTMCWSGASEVRLSRAGGSCCSSS